VDAAEREDAALPDRLQRVAERLALARRRGVGGVEHDRGARAQQAHRDALAAVALLEPVGDARADHAVHPALQDRRRLAPPVRVDDHDPVGGGELLAVARERRRKRRALRELPLREDRIEPLGVEVVEHDIVPARPRRAHRCGGEGVIEARRIGVSHEDEEVQGGPFGLRRMAGYTRLIPRAAQTSTTRRCAGVTASSPRLSARRQVVLMKGLHP